MLHGLGSEIQGAVLLELTSVWLVGHLPSIREEVLQHWLQTLRPMIEVNEKILFGDRHE